MTVLKKLESLKPGTKTVWRLELIYILLMLTVGFMEACSLTFGKRIISFFLWPGVFLGAFILALRLVYFRSYIRMKHFWLLAAFCLSYAVSTLANTGYGFYRNIRILILMTYLFFIVYGYSGEERSSDRAALYKIASLFYMAAAGILTLLSFITLFMGRSEIYYPETGPIYYVGFHWGRLFGVYWDANIGAVLCVFAVLIAMERFVRGRRAWKVLWLLYGLFQIAYVSFSGSRTGLLTLAVGLFLFVFLTGFGEGRKLWKAAAAGVAVAALAVVFLFGTKNLYNVVHRSRDIETVSVLVDKDHKTKVFSGSDAGAKIRNINRKTDELEEDVSNRRFDIWKSALDIFATAPAVGISHANVIPYVEDHLPDSYLINNSQSMDFDSMHNTFLDVLVGQGLIGLLLFLAIECSLAAAVWRGRKQLFSGQPEASSNALYVSGCGMLGVASVVITELVYVTSPMSILFWLGAGCLMMQLPRKGKEEVRSHG